MTAIKRRGSGKIASTDYGQIKFTGKTKAGKDIIIIIDRGINLGNIDLTMAEKDEIVPEIEFTGVYPDSYIPGTDTYEPWSIETTDEAIAGADEIILGYGVFSIGDTQVGLTRGGGQFTVEREYRQIKADGDRGYVEGRIVMDGSTPKMKFKALQIINNLTKLYPALETAPTGV